MKNKLIICTILFISLVVVVFMVCFFKSNNSQNKTDEIEAIECIYVDEQIDAKIFYPKIIGFNNKEKEKKINELIFREMEKFIIEGKKEIGNDFTVELKYDIKFINENMISIFYYGMYGENSEGQGLSSTAITTNIDINNEKLIMPKDIIIDYEKMAKLLLDDKFKGISVWEGMKGTDTISREYFYELHKSDMIDQPVDSKIYYGSWLIDKAVLWSEMYTGTTKDGVDEADVYDPEDFIGYELEYSDKIFRLGDREYENPQYVETYVTLENFNYGGRFKTPEVYDVIDNEQIQMGNGEINLLKTEVLQCVIYLEGENDYNGYSFIPVGTEIVLLNENTMLIGLWGEILLAHRIE